MNDASDDDFVRKVKEDLKWHTKHPPKGYKKAFIWDVFTIGIFVFAMFIAVPIVMNIGTHTTAYIANRTQDPNLNATQAASITSMGNGMFDNTPDVVMAFIYFILVLCSFILAGYEGANPAITLVLGLFFIILAEIISFGLADIGHSYINQVQNLSLKPHLSITTYIIENLPILNGVFTIAYIIFVISKKEVFGEGFASSGGGIRVINQ